MNETSSNIEKPKPISRIAIVGHGIEAWLTVNYLLAGLGSRQVKLTVLPVPGSDALDELYRIVPADSDVGLGSIGLSSAVLARECGASFSLGAQVNGHFKPYGKVGLDFQGLPFHHHILRANASMRPDDYFAWSPATSAMRRDAFAPPNQRNAIGKLRHEVACHVDTGLLTTLLRERAMRHGVGISQGSLKSVIRMQGSDRIVGLVNTLGETIQADLYVDCSGHERALMHGAAAMSWIPAPSLPAFQIAISKIEQSGMPPPWHRLTSKSEGWELEIPSPATQTRIVLASEATREDTRAFAAGHLAEPWIDNCVALGLAAASLLPIEPVQTKFLCVSINRMIGLLPGADCSPSETSEYNHLALTDLEEIHDLCAAYELARHQNRLDLSSVDIEQVHESLRNRLRLFKKCGWIAAADSDFLEPADWAGVFILLGLAPEATSRLASRMPMEILASHMSQLKVQIEKTSAEFPLHRDFLNAVLSAPRENASNHLTKRPTRPT
jgi:tryptophan halogenase